MGRFWHGTDGGFEAFDDTLDTTGLGTFLTPDEYEASDRFADGDDPAVVEVEADFEKVVYMDNLVDMAFKARILSGKRDMQAVADRGGYTIGQALCRNDFGRQVNEQLRAFAIRRGYDAIETEEEWMIALSSEKVRVVAVNRLNDVCP